MFLWYYVVFALFFVVKVVYVTWYHEGSDGHSTEEATFNPSGRERLLRVIFCRTEYLEELQEICYRLVESGLRMTHYLHGVFD